VLERDSELFGFRIARIPGSSLDREEAARVDDWCRANDVRCLYFLADPEDAETARVAAEGDYRVVDIRISIRRSLEGLAELAIDAPGGMEVDEAAEPDLAYLRDLAAESHRGSRFYSDGGFPVERCAALYRAWIDRGFRDPERSICVARVDGAPAGYQVVGPAAPDGTRKLELLAVDPRHHRRGVGPALVLSAMRLNASQGASATGTILSAGNVPSIRLHERLGFVTEGVQVWHHKWYGGG
jgi:GNAT superfamily N-acetyltransferase